MIPPEIQQLLDDVDAGRLTPLVGRLYGDDTIRVQTWYYTVLGAGAGDEGTGRSAVYRFAGQADRRGRPTAWSLAVKLLRTVPGDNDLIAGNREWAIYRSGFLDHLPGGVAAPRCLGTDEGPPGTYWIWMEEITDMVGPHWQLQDYAFAARHFGQFNGAYAGTTTLPDGAWVRRDWLRAWVPRWEAQMQTIFSQRAHPLIRRHFPDDVLAAVAALWADRWRFLAALDALPQTVCHLDAFRRNLFARWTADGTRQTVAVDWAFTSIGALGEELSAMTAANLAFFAVDAVTAREFTETVFAAYLDGLHDAGWRGDSGQVRLAFAIATPLRYALPIHAHHLLAPERVRWLEQVMGRPIEEVADRWATCIRWMLDLAQEARGRMNQVEV